MIVPLSVPLLLTVGGGMVFGCDTKSEAEEAYEEVRDRKEIVSDMEREAPQSAAEMREEVGLEEEDDPPPSTEEELRDEMDLHPDPPPDSEE